MDLNFRANTVIELIDQYHIRTPLQLLPLYITTTPLIHAHAHNDYQHKRPLLDALDHGFCSVEADVYLVDGRDGAQKFLLKK